MAVDDVSQLRAAMLRSQQKNETIPSDDNDMIVVDRGEVLLATDALDRNPRTLTEVPQDVFA